jgi:hypothetical protein
LREGRLVLLQLEQHAHERRDERLASEDENLRQRGRDSPASPVGGGVARRGLQRMHRRPFDSSGKRMYHVPPRLHADVRRPRWPARAPPPP